MLEVCAAVKVLVDYATEHDFGLAEETLLASLPAAVREMVPDFVEFHMALHGAVGEQPVATMCSLCRQVRSTDRQWFPFDAAAELLPEDVLFSHGLCSKCEVKLLAN